MQRQTKVAPTLARSKAALQEYLRAHQGVYAGVLNKLAEALAIPVGALSVVVRVLAD
jgi:hypothetical protein